MNSNSSSQNSISNELTLQIEVVNDNVDITKLDSEKIYIKQSFYLAAVKESQELGMTVEDYLISLLKAEIAKDMESRGVDMRVD